MPIHKTRGGPCVRKHATLFDSYFESCQMLGSASCSLRKFLSLRHWDVAEEFNGEMNVVRMGPAGFNFGDLSQSTGMVGEFLLQIRWKIDCAENPPCVTH